MSEPGDTDFNKLRTNFRRISIGEKVAYVKGQQQTRAHHCHWPGCTEQVPPAMWGCKKHWYELPKYLRDRIWEAYNPGQEINLTPSREYVEIAREVQNWIEEYESQLSELYQQEIQDMAGKRKQQQPAPDAAELNIPQGIPQMGGNNNHQRQFSKEEGFIISILSIAYVAGGAAGDPETACNLAEEHMRVFLRRYSMTMTMPDVS